MECPVSGLKTKTWMWTPLWPDRPPFLEWFFSMNPQVCVLICLRTQSGSLDEISTKADFEGADIIFMLDTNTIQQLGSWSREIRSVGETFSHLRFDILFDYLVVRHVLAPPDCYSKLFVESAALGILVTQV